MSDRTIEVDQVDGTINNVHVHEIREVELDFGKPTRIPKLTPHAFHHLVILNLTDLATHAFASNLVQVSRPIFTTIANLFGRKKPNRDNDDRNPSKSPIKSLGHIASSHLHSVAATPINETTGELAQFLDVATHFGKEIPNFNSRIGPISRISGDEHLKWDKQRVAAYQYDLGSCTAGEHDIVTTSDTPVSSKPHRTPFKYRDELQKHIDQLLASGVMVESDTPWVSNIVLVQKKDEPLTRLTKKETNFEWGTEQAAAFNEMLLMLAKAGHSCSGMNCQKHMKLLLIAAEHCQRLNANGLLSKGN
ncbi:hypothetical protein niasHT_031565 [Heterodera trifolii]|uniref:Uncharacterized protein n=1 Tax=Heterodera trifolii TaxID=157864 RepID=A0ABD2J3A7_9BILA